MKTIYAIAHSITERFRIRPKALAIAALLLGSAPVANAQQIYALSDGDLVSFDAGFPALLSFPTTISGVTSGQALVGLDFRPSTGELYALGYNITTGESRLYEISTASGNATPVGPGPVMLSAGLTRIGFDFNPTVDRIRVTAGGGQNYRLHPETGALLATDGTLAYAAGDPNSGTVPAIGTSAYANSYIAATSTTLYGYDDNLNVFTTQNPPNNGTLNTLGTSGITVNTAEPTSDLDIYYNAVTGENIAYFVANTGSSSNDNLYTVNLATGDVTSLGGIGLGTPIEDIAVEIERVVPPNIDGDLIYGLTTNNYLISFDSDLPATVRTHMSITGVDPNQTLVGLDSRPSTGELYALGYNSTTGAAQLYTIDPDSAVATPVTSNTAALAVGMTGISFDFNPTVDRIRVTSSGGKNYRLHPVTGAIAATDTDLDYAVGDPNESATPMIGTSAYINSYIGSTSTTLYNYDWGLNTITMQNPPNNGTLNTVGNSGISVNSTDPSIDMDVTYDGVLAMNRAFMVANTGISTYDTLYSVNLSTGEVDVVGAVGYGTALRNIAFEIDLDLPSDTMGQIVFGVTSSGSLITFDSEAPAVVRSQTGISGIAGGQRIVGMDMRPATMEIYLMGYNGTNGEAQLYTLNQTTGLASSVAAPITLAADMGDIGFDFNPTVDRIRVVSSNNQNYRLHPTTGAIVATDSTLRFSAGDVNFGIEPRVGSAAYTNSYNGASATTLYVYDDSLNALLTQNPPNNGMLNTVGNSGIIFSTVDRTTDIDIYYNPINGNNTAYFVGNESNSDALYTVNLNTGAFTSVGTVGMGIALWDIAVMMDSSSMVSIADYSTPQADLYLYPNPMDAQATLLMSMKTASDVRVEIVDLQGRTIAHLMNQRLIPGTHELRLDTESIQPGLYLVKCTFDTDQVQTIKAVIH